jgi:glycosyltransferase involved in cell wall biosynthesis
MKFNGLKVLHIVGAMNRGGVETWLMHTLRNLDREKYSMEFLCLSGLPGVYAKEIEVLGGKVHTLRLNRLRLDFFVKNFFDLLDRGQFEVIHSHVSNFSGLLLWLASMKRVPQRIAHFHTSKVNVEEKSHSWARSLYLRGSQILLRRAATKFLACSQVAMGAFLGEGWEQNPSCEVLYYGIDLSSFRYPVDREAVRQVWGIPTGAKVVGTVGRFVLAKNHEFLVEVAAELCQRRPDVRFLLVGGGERQAAIENLVQQQGLSSFFVFTGSRPDVPRLMQAMDLFVLPSVREGLGIVLVEAQAAGLPLVTSQLPVLREVVFTPFQRRLPFDERIWADACEDFLESEPRGQPSLRLWKDLERFSLEHCVRRLSEIYEDARIG